MDSIKSLKWRYAVKKFNKNKSLTTKQITILKEAFNLTATSYGLQPLKLVVLNDKKIQKELVAHSWNQPQVYEASHLLIICIPNTFTSEDVENYFSLVKQIRNTEDKILSPFKKFLSSEIDNKSKEELNNWNKNQAYLALGNLLTVCAYEKIDACPMEGFIPEKYDEVLNLKEQGLQSVLALPVGFRADDDYMASLKKVRKPLQESIIEI